MPPVHPNGFLIVYMSPQSNADSVLESGQSLHFTTCVVPMLRRLAGMRGSRGALVAFGGCRNIRVGQKTGVITQQLDELPVEKVMELEILGSVISPRLH